MPQVRLGTPPTRLEGAGYRAFKDWLLEHFVDHICAYCLFHSLALEVEHYEPKTYAKHRTNDPFNLLLACPPCNGPGGKHDYHPLHTSRKRWNKDTTGHLVIDVRADDFAAMFEIRPDGSIEPRRGDRKREERAAWNIVLLDLNSRDAKRTRLEVLDLHAACEALVRTGKDDDVLSTLLPWLARRALLLEVYGLPVTESLRARLAELRAAMF